jgi:hypothetical protein
MKYSLSILTKILNDGWSYSPRAKYLDFIGELAYQPPGMLIKKTLAFPINNSQNPAVGKSLEPQTERFFDINMFLTVEPRPDCMIKVNGGLVHVALYSVVAGDRIKNIQMFFPVSLIDERRSVLEDNQDSNEENLKKIGNLESITQTMLERLEVERSKKIRFEIKRMLKSNYDIAKNKKWIQHEILICDMYFADAVRDIVQNFHLAA